MHSRILNNLMVSVALFSLAGGQLAILQTIAWGRMLHKYSIEQGSLREGIVKTFSGKSPCKLCKRVLAESQRQEKSPAGLKLEKKHENRFLPAWASLAMPPWRRFVHLNDGASEPPDRCDPPPGPVPRFS